MQWLKIGAFLDLSQEELDRVVSKCGPTQCMMSMFQVWLSRKEPPPTWRAILEVVDFMDPQLANQLRQKILT